MPLVSGRVSLVACPLVFLNIFFPFASNLIFSVRKKMSPDVTSYGALVSSCEKDAEWQLALHFLREFQGFCHEKIGGKPSGGKFCVEKSWYFRVFQGFPTVNLDSKLEDWPRKNTAHLLFVVSTKCVFLGVFLLVQLFFPCNTQRLIFFWHPSKNKAFKGFSYRSRDLTVHLTYKMGPGPNLRSGVITPINGRKYMANWDYFTSMGGDINPILYCYL